MKPEATLRTVIVAAVAFVGGRRDDGVEVGPERIQRQPRREVLSPISRGLPQSLALSDGPRRREVEDRGADRERARACPDPSGRDEQR